MDAQRVHVAWGDAALLATQAAHACLDQALSDEEKARYAAIASPVRRHQFIAARWLLRTLLADVHGGDPMDWPLGAGVDGPPSVQRATSTPVHLALSHSADVVACAVAREPIGLDIEAPRRQRDVLALAQLACDTDEQALLRSQPAQARDALFYEIWTAKEAWLKRLHQPMAPRRMARIHLRSAPSFDASPLRVWGREGWTLALAAPAGMPVHWHAEAPVARRAWTADDEGEPVSAPA